MKPLAALVLALTPGLAHASLASGEAPPDVALVDVNPSSPTAGLPVAPTSGRGVVSVWYFAQDPAAVHDVGALDAFDTDLGDDDLTVDVYVVVPPPLQGEVGDLVHGHDVKVLVDQDGALAAAWGAGAGDVVLLDLDGRVHDRFPGRQVDHLLRLELEDGVERIALDETPADPALAAPLAALVSNR